VHVAQLDHLLALLVALQVDRLASDDPGDRPRARVHDEALADQHLRVPASHRAKPQKAVVVDVGDDQPDLVDVAHHEQAPRRRPAARPGGDERQRCADDVHAGLRELARGGQPGLRRRPLVSGGAACGEQLAQQRRHAGRGARACPGAGPAPPRSAPPGWCWGHRASSARST
jgi:hypothetical protein